MALTDWDVRSLRPWTEGRLLATSEDRETHLPVDFDPAVFEELAAHAQACFPEECCGLVFGFGDTQLRYARAVRCSNRMTGLHRRDPVRYPQDGRYAFDMNPLDYLEASCQAHTYGQSVTAIYHSHVGSGVHLSARDREFASRKLTPFPQADQLVISISKRGDVLDMGLFQRVWGTDAFIVRRVERGCPRRGQEIGFFGVGAKDRFF